MIELASFAPLYPDPAFTAPQMATAATELGVKQKLVPMSFDAEQQLLMFPR